MRQPLYAKLTSKDIKIVSMKKPQSQTNVQPVPKPSASLTTSNDTCWCTRSLPNPTHPQPPHSPAKNVKDSPSTPELPSGCISQGNMQERRLFVGRLSATLAPPNGPFCRLTRPKPILGQSESVKKMEARMSRLRIGSLDVGWMVARRLLPANTPWNCMLGRCTRINDPSSAGYVNQLLDTSAC